MATNQSKNGNVSGKIHNVLVGGNSIGLTPDRSEADTWARSSMSGLKVEIHTQDHTIDPKYLERP